MYILNFSLDAEQSVPKIGGNDSESDSDASVGGNSLDLASSHSSDEDDEFEIGLSWEQQVPKSIKVGKFSLCIVFLFICSDGAKL